MTRKQLILRIATAVAVGVGAVAALGLPAGAATQATPQATHAGMTWVVRTQTATGLVNVGADATTNAFQGDTLATASLPVLCLSGDGSPAPAGLVLDEYNGWAFGTVALTPAVAGRELVSLEAANRICVRTFGHSWRMAEHHDGWYQGRPTGWHFWAKARGVLSQSSRFWVYIDDQPATCWTTVQA